MAASRELLFLLKLRNDMKNKEEITRLRKEVGNLQKAMSQMQGFSDKAVKNTKATGREIKNLRVDADKAAASMRGISEATAKTNSGKLKEVSEVIEKVSESARRAKKEFGSFAREGIPSVKGLYGAVVPLNNAMHDHARMMDSIARHHTSLSGAVANSHAEFRNLHRTMGQTAGLFGAMNNAIKRTTTGTIEFTRELSVLETRIRDLQAVSQLRGLLNVRQDIKSLRIFQEQIEVLRKSLADVANEGTRQGAGLGVTKEMIATYRKLNAEIHKYQQRLYKVPEAVEALRKSEENLILEELKGGQIRKLTIKQAIQEYKQLGEVIDIETTEQIEDHIRLRDAAIKAFKEIGVAKAAYAYKSETFARLEEENAHKIMVSQSELAATVRKLTVEYNRASRKIIQNVKEIGVETKQIFQGQKPDIEAAVTVYEKLEREILQVTNIYRELRVKTIAFGKSWTTSSQGMKEAAAALKELESLLAILPPELAKSVAWLKQWHSATFIAAEATFSLSKFMVQLYADVDKLAVKEKVLAEATQYLGKTEQILGQQVDLARRRLEHQTNAVVFLTEHLQKLRASGKGTSAAIRLITDRLMRLGQDAKLSQQQLEQLIVSLEQLRRRGGDSARSMSRITSRGFADMIVSQAAWMAGFQVIFGTLDRFKQALASVADLQQALVRAMRTARSETMSQKEIFEAYSKAITEARRTTGTSIEELGEIMYQLGSAGLSAEESVAALNSTLANIIGTEAEVRDITKLVAGLYNNFSEQIVRVDGQIVSISNTFDGYNDQLVETATLQEKFAYINNLLVKGFKDNQVEMNELRDGLKFMAQSAKVANLALSEQVGILAFLNNHLIKAGTAGRAMRVILSRMTKDVTKFAEAFDIKIDLNQPLDFLSIIQKINKRLGGQAATVRELGTVFKRLGLRGAEAFNLLIRNSDVVVATIERLESGLEGAAEEMKAIRLGDFASQAKIAGANLETFLRKGVTPLLGASSQLVGVFNVLGDSIVKLNNFLGGTLGWMTTIAGKVFVFTAMAFIFNKIGVVMSWMNGVVINLTKNLAMLGKVEKEDEVATNLLTGAKVRLNIALREYKIAASQAAAATVTNTASMGTMQKSMGFLTAQVAGMKAAFASLGAVMKGVIWIGVLTVIFELIDYLSSLATKMREQAAKFREAGDEVATYINKIDTLKRLVQSQTEGTKDHTKTVKELADVLRLSGNEYDSVKEKVGELIKVSNAEIALHTKLKDLKRAEEYEKLSRSINLVKQSHWRYGKQVKGFMGQVKELINPMSELHMSFHALGIDLHNLTKGGLEEKMLNLSSTIDRLKESVSAMKVNAAGISDAFQAKEVQERITYEEKYIATLERERSKTNELLKEKEREMLVRKQITETVKKEINYEEMLAEALEKTKDVMLQNSDSIYKYQEAVRSSQQVMEAFSRSGVTFGADALNSISRAMEQLEKTTVDETLRKISTEMDLLSQKLDKYEGGEKGFKKILDGMTKVFVDGRKLAKEFGKEIDATAQRIDALDKTIRELKTADFSSRIAGNTFAASELSSALDTLQGVSAKYQADVDNQAKAVHSATTELEKLNQVFVHTKARTKESSDAYRDWSLQKQIVAVMTERETRAQEKFDKQVREGVFDIKALQDRTESFRQTTEDMRIKILRAESALRKTKYGTEEYRKAQLALELLKKESVRTQAQYNRSLEQEAENLRKMKQEVFPILSAYKENIGLLEKQRTGIEGAIEAERKRIKERGEGEALTKAQLEANMRSYEVIKGLMSELQGVDKTIYDTKKQINDIEKDTGAKTERQAYLKHQENVLEKMNAQSKLVREEGELRKDQIKNAELLQTKEKSRLDLYQQKLGELETKLGDFESKWETLVEKLAKGFVPNVGTEHLDKFYEKAKAYFKELGDMPITPAVASKTAPVESYSGGVIKRASGGMVPARVTHGEGYISPQQAFGNLAMLNSLNSGRTMNMVPNSIGMFHGKRGVDRIPTYLPTGSYVLSKKGMEAYERSMAQGAAGYAAGGEVEGSSVGESDNPVSGRTSSDFGTITLVVQSDSGAKSFPLHGEASVLNDVRKALGTDRLTKLN
ncbi:MAG TPA: phage tail tape measure protein [Patescibacteria group bacterium]|nr:phage tail tape measure protein [Patescibacteria group bacterium]